MTATSRPCCVPATTTSCTSQSVRLSAQTTSCHWRICASSQFLDDLDTVQYLMRIVAHVFSSAMCVRRHISPEENPPVGPEQTAQTVTPPADGSQEPQRSSSAASPMARTPPTAPRVRALKRLVQTKNRCSRSPIPPSAPVSFLDCPDYNRRNSSCPNRPPSPMPTASELARGAIRPVLAPLQQKCSTLCSLPVSDGNGFAKASIGSGRRLSRFSEAGPAGSGGLR